MKEEQRKLKYTEWRLTGGQIDHWTAAMMSALQSGKEEVRQRID